jgi:hypothetical protein
VLDRGWVDLESSDRTTAPSIRASTAYPSEKRSLGAMARQQMLVAAKATGETSKAAVFSWKFHSNPLIPRSCLGTRLEKKDNEISIPARNHNPLVGGSNPSSATTDRRVRPGKSRWDA